MMFLDHPSADLQPFQSGFYNWINRSTQHLPAFLAAFQTAQEKHQIDRYKLIAIRGLLDGIPPEIPSNVAPIRPDHWRRQEQAPSAINDQNVRSQPMNRVKWIAGGSIGVLGLAVMALVMWPSHLTSYRTSVGEHVTVNLRDGTSVTLNTRSEIEFGDLSGKTRELRLVMGEALIRVKHDSQHPFRLRTPTAVIEDIGTLFDARVQHDTV